MLFVPLQSRMRLVGTNYKTKKLLHYPPKDYRQPITDLLVDARRLESRRVPLERGLMLTFWENERGAVGK